MKKTIIQFGLISFLFLCFFIGCKKQETINKIEEEVEMETIVDPKEWFYASKQSRIKQDPLNNIDQINGVAKNSKGLVKEEKLPKWSQKREKTIKNTQIFEYVISYKVMNLFIPSSIKNSSEKKRYGNSIVNKAVFIKKNDGFSLNVISFLPDPEYLKMTGYNTSKYSFIDFDTKYTGAILIYNWNSELIKAYNYKNGKKIGDIKISWEENNSQIKKENPCGVAEPYEQWYRICSGFIVGDIYEDEYCIEGYNQQLNFDYSGCNDTNVPNNTCDDPTTPMNECDQTPEDFFGNSDPSNNNALFTTEIIDELDSACFINAWKTITSAPSNINHGSVIMNEFASFLHEKWGVNGSYNLFIKQGLTDPDPQGRYPDADTKTLNGQSISIRINPDLLNSHSSQEYVVATMIHEVIHGLINGKIPSNVPIGDRKEWLNNFEHETMANEYVDLMTNTLILLFPNMSRADASSLSWGGIGYSSAFKAKPDADKSIIFATNLSHRSGTSGTKCK